MKKVSPILMTFVLLLTACGGPMTLSYGSSTLNYDSGTWEEFESESGKGFAMKGSDSCWADLEGDLTMPLPSEMDTLLSGTLDGITVYSYAAVPLGYDQEAAPCLEAIRELAAMN